MPALFHFIELLLKRGDLFSHSENTIHCHQVKAQVLVQVPDSDQTSNRFMAIALIALNHRRMNQVFTFTFANKFCCNPRQFGGFS